MEKDIRGNRCQPGGIISLAQFVTKHREAVEYDLLTLTGHEINDIGRTLSWSALKSFVRNLKEDSAVYRAINPEYAVWGSTTKTNVILADIFDVLMNINANLVAIGSRKTAKQPKPYPRPGVEDDDVKRFGKNALPPDELKKWLEAKREEHKKWQQDQKLQGHM